MLDEKCDLWRCGWAVKMSDDVFAGLCAASMPGHQVAQPQRNRKPTMWRNVCDVIG
ncbi:MAG TPA: hypothetical protein VI456_04640 [Polyangia bacterium]